MRYFRVRRAFVFLAASCLSYRGSTELSPPLPNAFVPKVSPTEVLQKYCAESGAELACFASVAQAWLSLSREIHTVILAIVGTAHEW